MTDSKPWHGVDHPENFPVGSWLVPAGIRPAVQAIYRFARHADDLADEGDDPPEVKDRALQALDEALQRAAAGAASGVPVVDALTGPVARHGLQWDCFRDLIDAFRQDLRQSRYEDQASVLDYCRRSANPVGRLMLQLSGVHDDPACCHASDAICSALQRINFLQDIGIDARKDRVYLPASTLAEAGIDAGQLLSEALAGRLGPASRRAVALELRRTRQQMLAGHPLPARLPWRMAAEIRFVMAGGHRILDRIEQAGYDPVASRPRLGWRDAPALLAGALRVRRP